MNELVILSFDTPAEADQARQALQQVTRQGIVVLPDLDTAVERVAQARARPSRLRRWALLPWQASAKALGSALTALTWTSLIVGAAAGELAERLMGRDEQDELRQQVTQAVSSQKVPVIVLAQGQASAEWIEAFAQSSDHVYRTRVSPDAAARIQSAFGSS
jgi:uncharacterized membrane protein